MKIFITGGTGFVGKHLVRRLLRGGHALLVFSKEAAGKDFAGDPKRPGAVEFFTGDMLSIRKHLPRLKRFRPEVSIHLAWEGIPSDAAELALKNLLGGIEVIKAVLETGSRAIIGVGSCYEYADTSGRVDERAPLQPRNTLYAAKAALGWLGAKLAAERGGVFIWTRPSFIYGPGQRPGALIPSFVRTLKKGEAPVLKNPRGGNDFIYVEDVAEALAKIAESYRRLESGAFNIGSGRLTPIAEVVRRVYRKLGCKPPASVNLRRGAKIQGFCLDISRIEKATKWKPVVSLERGIQETVAHIVSENRFDNLKGRRYS